MKQGNLSSIKIGCECENSGLLKQGDTQEEIFQKNRFLVSMVIDPIEIIARTHL